MKGTKRLAVLAMFTAIALTIFVAEAQIPPVVPIPGVKLGLANIVTLIAMALLGRRQAGEILLVRIVLGSVFTGGTVSVALLVWRFITYYLCLIVGCADSIFTSLRKRVKPIRHEKKGQTKEQS